MKKVKNISLILLVLALLIIGSSSIVVTNENEYSLIRQFGKVDHVVSSAGVTFKIPFVQSVDKLPKEILLYDLSSSDVITSDKKTMICDSYILWQINDPLKFAQTLNSSISNAESRLDTIVYNSTIISIRFRRPSQIRALRRRQSTLIFQIMSGMILQRSLPRRFIIRNQIIEIEVC